MGKFKRVLLVAVLTTPLALSGCRIHQTHTWGPAETNHYTQWEHETNRNHLEWERRSDADQKAYWEWRDRHHD
ncbi:MAG TPA: hypothetical protein VGI45_24140 [Terracidiphilus sp.]|jgi:hypothetical protein